MEVGNSLHKLSSVNGLALVCCVLLLSSAVLAALPIQVNASSQVVLKVDTNYNSYYYMQTVGVYANLTSGGTPVKDGIIALEIDRPNISWDPIVFRTIKGSQPPNPALLDQDLEIVSINAVDKFYQPRTYFRRGETCYFNVTINNSGTGKVGMITASIFDLALVPLSASTMGTPGFPFSIPAGISMIRFSLEIPTWAALGTAVIYINIFRNSPLIYGGVPLSNEKSKTFQIKSFYGPAMNVEGNQVPESFSTGMTGIYNFSWRVPPYPVLGEYTVYTAGNYTNATPNMDSATFQVASSSTPPQASFTYSPAAPYAGGTTYFDASASFSYNGTITNYKWAWGDGTPQSSTSSPFITHVFANNGTFLVTLNVTDSQGLWCTTQKPIPVSGPTPPDASFTFYPSPTWIGANTTFDASSSTPGWNGTGFVPIVKYDWSFGDSAVANETDPRTYHIYSALGNFSAKLTITDARGWKDSFSLVVQVINVTVRPELVVTDVTIVGPYELSPDYWEPYKGWSGDIKVTVLNNGTTKASFNVTMYYANVTSYSLGRRSVVDLPSQTGILLVFQWNTSVAKPTMNYTLTANATILLGETNLQNNRYDVIARVKGPGDINGNGAVNIQDASPLGVSWLKTVPPGDPRADVNLNGVINIADASIVGANWGKTYL